MDFIISLLLTIVVILIIINFTSISISDTANSGQQCVNNRVFPLFGQYQIPQPTLAMAPSALNNKIKLEEQSYDYNKHFYM